MGDEKDNYLILFIKIVLKIIFQKKQMSNLMKIINKLMMLYKIIK